MFVRITDLIVKPGMTSELRNTVNGAIREILLRQPGFHGVTILANTREARSVLLLRLGATMESAERYERQASAEVLEILKPVLDAEPRVRLLSAGSPAHAGILACPAA